MLAGQGKQVRDHQWLQYGHTVRTPAGTPCTSAIPAYLGTQYLGAVPPTRATGTGVHTYLHTYLGTYVPALSSIAYPIRQASPFLSAGHTSCLPLRPFSDLMPNSQELIGPPLRRLSGPAGLPPSTHVGASIGVSITCACRAPLHTVTTDHRARPNEAILPGAPNSSPPQAKPGAAALLLVQATRVPAIPRIPLPAWLGPVRNVGTPVRKGPCQFIAERATCLRNTSASSTLLLFYC